MGIIKAPVIAVKMNIIGKTVYQNLLTPLGTIVSFAVSLTMS
ncbi:hypothetical protein ES705_21052 [subsurface metagenome]